MVLPADDLAECSFIGCESNKHIFTLPRVINFNLQIQLRESSSFQELLILYIVCNLLIYFFSGPFPMMNTNRILNRSNTVDEKNEPKTNNNSRTLLTPIWKIRIMAVLTICVLVVPGNIATLYIYAKTEGNIKIILQSM